MLRNGKGAVTVSSGSFSTHKGQIHSMGGRRQKPSPNRLENIMLVIYLVWEYNQYVSCPKCVLHYVAVHIFHKGGFKIEKKKSNIVPAVDGHCTFSRLWEKECKKRRGRNNKGILMDNKSV